MHLTYTNVHPTYVILVFARTTYFVYNVLVQLVSDKNSGPDQIDWRDQPAFAVTTCCVFMGRFIIMRLIRVESRALMQSCWKMSRMTTLDYPV